MRKTSERMFKIKLKNIARNRIIATEEKPSIAIDTISNVNQLPIYIKDPNATTPHGTIVD